MLARCEDDAAHFRKCAQKGATTRSAQGRFERAIDIAQVDRGLAQQRFAKQQEHGLIEIGARAQEPLRVDRHDRHVQLPGNVAHQPVCTSLACSMQVDQRLPRFPRTRGPVQEPHERFIEATSEAPFAACLILGHDTDVEWRQVASDPAVHRCIRNEERDDALVDPHRAGQ